MSQAPPVSVENPDVAEALSLVNSAPALALELLRHAAARSPQLAPVRAALAEVLFRINALESAANEIRVAMQLAPEESGFWRLAALIAQQRERRGDAIRSASRAVECDLTNIELLELLANTQEKGDDSRAAILTRQKTVALKPDDVRIVTGPGAILHGQERDDEAYEQFQRAIALSPNSWGGHSATSLASACLGKTDAALTAIRRAIALEPRIGGFFSHFGHLLLRMGELNSAIEDFEAFERAAKLEPQNAEVHYVLADLCNRRSDFATALDHAREAAKFGPNVARFHARLGQFLASRSRHTEAVEPMRRAVSIEPDNEEFHAQLADACEKIGDLEGAVAELRHILRMHPGSASILLQLCRVLERMGDIAGPESIIDEALASGDHSEALVDQKRRLQDVKNGNKFVLVPSRYLAIKIQDLVEAQVVTTKQTLVHTNFLDLNAQFGRHHLEQLYIDRQRWCPAVTLYRVAPEARLAVATDEDLIPVYNHSVVAEQIRPGWNDRDISQAIAACKHEGQIDGPSVVIGRYGTRTWGHWLGELLPKIVAVESCHPGMFRYVVPRVLVDIPAHRTALESLRYYGIDADRLTLVSPGTCYAASDLHLVSSVWSPDHMVHPHVMELMRTSGKHGNEVASGGRRIALLRRAARTRRIANITEVEGFLIEKGWSVVDIEEMDFRQQVGLFRSADAVVSVLGSGLAGLIYAPRGVKVVTLAPSDWGDLFFFALMQERDASLADIRGQSIADSQQEVAIAAFNVEPSAIEAGLVALGLSDAGHDDTRDRSSHTTSASSSIKCSTDPGTWQNSAAGSQPNGNYQVGRVGMQERAMTAIKDDLLRKIWRGLDPFASHPRDLYRNNDVQGWCSNHPYLTEAIEESRPRVVVEIGVWKGASTITMAQKLKELGIDGVVIAIDTWLGSWDHWTQSWFEHLSFDKGFPAIYHKFIENVMCADLRDFIIPLPLDSVNALHVLKHHGIRPDVVHIDGGNDYTAVSTDLNEWWAALNDSGIIIGNDYYRDGAWPEVRAAFDDFFRARGVEDLENTDGKCRVRKPLANG